jgi:catalase
MAEIVSKFHGMIPGQSGETMETDKSHVTTASVLYDAIFIAGGKKSVEAMMKQGDVIHFINEAYKHGKPIAASGEAVRLFRKATIPGANLAGDDDKQVVSHMGVVTASSPESLDDFVDQFHKAILQHRHWDRASFKEEVPA